jgi:hypothetical protein
MLLKHILWDKNTWLVEMTTLFLVTKMRENMREKIREDLNPQKYILMTFSFF